MFVRRHASASEVWVSTACIVRRGRRYMLQGTVQLAYNLFRNAAYTNVWGSRTWGLSPTPKTINVDLDGSGRGSASEIVYGRIFSGQSSLLSGPYNSSFAVRANLLQSGPALLRAPCAAP